MTVIYRPAVSGYPDLPTGDCEHDNGACWYGPDFWVCDMCGETVEES